MEFDKSKVYTALNATEDLIGAKGYFADYIEEIEELILMDVAPTFSELKQTINYKFVNDLGHYYNFFYPVEPAPDLGFLKEKKIERVCSEISGTPLDYFKAGIEYANSADDDDKEITTYRPFKDCGELIKTYYKKLNHKIDIKLELPIIWVMNRNNPSAKHSITDFIFNGNLIFIRDWENLDELFNNYAFLDGSPCGIKIKE